MGTFEEDLLLDAEDDRQTVEYIKNYLPQDLKDRFTEDELYYFIDVIGEYYVDLLDKHSGDEDIDIDVEDVAKFVAKQAKKDKMGDFDPEDLRWVVDGELEYGSPKKPLFPEAEMLHYLDMTDAKMFDMEDAIRNVEPGGFSDKVFTLDNRKIYRRTF